MRLFERRLIVVVSAALLMASGCSKTPDERYALALEKGKKWMENQDPAHAALEFQNANRAKPKKPEAYYLLAQAFLKGNHLRDAIVALRKATDADPNYAPAQVKLAE